MHHIGFCWSFQSSSSAHDTVPVPVHYPHFTSPSCIVRIYQNQMWKAETLIVKCMIMKCQHPSHTERCTKMLLLYLVLSVKLVTQYVVVANYVVCSF
jgi:hypothetical protein